MRAYLVITVLLWSLAAWFLIVPLFSPRGYFLGQYRTVDLGVGTILLAFAGLLSIVLILPAQKRRAAGIRIVMVFTSLGGAFLTFDLAYTLVFLGAWKPNHWLDRAHISRAHNLPDSELGFVRKPYISWGGEPGYKTDEHGFRNPPGIRKADIVFLGDSYTEAAHVPEQDTFPARVARAADLRAVNLGRGAYGPQQELIVLRRYGIGYGPRYVVWQLFDGNDLADAEEYRLWRSGLGPPALSLAQRYFAQSLLRQSVKKLLQVPEMPGPAVWIAQRAGSYTRTIARYPYRADTHESSSAVQETRRAILEGAQLCKEAGAQLIVLFIPTMVQVHSEEISFDDADERRRYLPPTSGTDRDFAALASKWCTEADCEFVNALDRLRKMFRDQRHPVYIPADEHLTSAGHRAVASIIVELLEQSPSRKNRTGNLRSGILR